MNRRGEATREALYAAFGELVFARPMAMCDLVDVVTAARVSKGAFYAQFRGIDDLAAGFLEAEFKRAYEVVRSRVDAHGPSLELLVALVFESTAYLLTTPRFHAALLVQAEIGRDMCDSSDFDRWRNVLDGILQHAQETGDIRADVDVAAFADFFLAAWTGARFLSDVTVTQDELPRRVTSMLRFALSPILTPSRAYYFDLYIDRYQTRLPAVDRNQYARRSPALCVCAPGEVVTPAADLWRRGGADPTDRN